MNEIRFVGEHTTKYEVRRHLHDCWELVYCTQGSGCFSFDDDTQIAYRQGDAVAIPPMLPHSNSTKTGFSNIHIRIYGSAFSEDTPFSVSDDPEKHLQQAFQQAKYYYLSDFPSCDLVMGALAELIINHMSIYRSSTEYSDPVKKIKSKIMLCHAECDFALDQYIKTLPFHYDYLRKLFKKEIGVTPLEYMTRLRMKRACVLLTMQDAEDFSIAEIAQLCGFDDSLYFSRVFKKHYNVSPSAFAGRK